MSGDGETKALQSPFLRDGGRVLLVRDDDERPGVVEAVARFFRSFPGPIRVEVAAATVRLPLNRPVERQSIFDAAARARHELAAGVEPFIAVLTPSANDWNWFSAVNAAAPHNLFVHTADWEWISSASTECLVAHQIVENILEGALGECGLDVDEIAHEKADGCLNDMCNEKVDIRLKLRTGDICAECMGRLEAHGASPELLRQVVAILDACRRASVATGRYAASTADYSTWPFPVAFTWHRAQVAREPLYRFLLLLDHFDALVRHVCIARARREGRRLDVRREPSLGDWSKQLERDVTGLGHVVTLSEQKEIVELRNELRGHGYVQHGVFAYEEGARRVEAGLDAMHRLFDEVESGWELRGVTTISLSEGSYRLSGERLVGSNTLWPGFDDELPPGRAPLAAGLKDTPGIALWEIATGRYVPLQPYYQLMDCGECHHRRLLVVDGMEGARVTRYIDIVVGHRWDVPR